MIRRIFIDTNVLLDVSLAREPHVAFSASVLDLCEKASDVVGLSSTLSLANFYYILRQTVGSAEARAAVGRVRELLEVQAVNDHDLGQALVSEFSDLEDGIQYFTAVHGKAEAIVTRNVRDFRPSVLPVLTPQEFLTLVNS